MSITTTAVTKGKVQDLSKVVTNISPEETPFQSMIGKDKAVSSVFSWTEEALAAPGENAAIEGSDAPDAVDNVLTERSNRAQIFDKTVSISGTAQVEALAGNVQTMAHQTMLRAKELKKDVEHAYVGTGQVSTAETSSKGRLTAGFQAQLESTMVMDKNAAVTEDDINEMLVRCEEAGAKPSVLMAHSRIRAAMAKTLFGAAHRRELVADGKFDMMVSVYASDAGEVKIVTNNAVRYDTAEKKGDILIIDPKMWTEHVLRDYKIENLAKKGDADSKYLVIEKGLKNKHYSGSALISNVTI